MRLRQCERPARLPDDGPAGVAAPEEVENEHEDRDREAGQRGITPTATRIASITATATPTRNQSALEKAGPRRGLAGPVHGPTLPDRCHDSDETSRRQRASGRLGLCPLLEKTVGGRAGAADIRPKGPAPRAASARAASHRRLRRGRSAGAAPGRVRGGSRPAPAGVPCGARRSLPQGQAGRSVRRPRPWKA